MPESQSFPGGDESIDHPPLPKNRGGYIPPIPPRIDAHAWNWHLSDIHIWKMVQSSRNSFLVITCKALHRTGSGASAENFRLWISPLRAGPQQALLWASFQTYLLLLQFTDNIYVGTSGVASKALGGGASWYFFFTFHYLYQYAVSFHCIFLHYNCSCILSVQLNLISFKSTYAKYA